jgi:hypothetical protein
MSMRSFVALVVLAALPLVACTPVATTQGTPTPSETAQVDATVTPEVPVLPPAVLAAQQSLASALGLPVDEVTLIEATPVDWPDSCLGAAQPDEMCAQVITPGYRLAFDTPQGQYVIHSDQTGRTYRQVTPALGGTPVPEVTEVPILPTREPPAPGSSGIEGQVLIGPACPGPVSIDSPCPDQPFPATLTILTAQNARVGQVTTDAAGRFRLTLAPGSYLIRPEPPKQGIAYAADQPVDVVAGAFAFVEIVYDSGMR